MHQMPPIALWLCFAALAQPRRFRQPQKLGASRSSQKAEEYFNKSLHGQPQCSLLQRSLAAALADTLRGLTCLNFRSNEPGRSIQFVHQCTSR
jgi:hypothetical protein